jgi:methylase of polypeptide subunit release factors
MTSAESVERTVVLQGVPVVECSDATHAADHATRFLARHVRIVPGTTVVEAGCGTGVLAMLAARLGARAVHATDVDSRALELLQAALARNGITNVTPRAGSLLEPVPAGTRLDAVVAVLPQKPAPSAFDVRYAGGADGTDLLRALIEQAAARLRPGGALWLFHHTLAAPARIEAALGRAFAWRAVAERWRCVAAAAYDALAPGMLARVRELARAGTVCAWERGPWLVWRSRVLEARRR